MSFSRKAARAQARAQGPIAPPSGSTADRMHLFNANMKEIRAAGEAVPTDHVIVVCDTRDHFARKLAQVAQGQARLDQHHVTCLLGRVIPTVILSIPVEVAIDLTALVNPTVSETIEMMRGQPHRMVLVIAGGGTLLQAIPKGPVKTVIQVLPDYTAKNGGAS